MTKLSVNLNKIALLRNSRGKNFPNVMEYAKQFIDLGVHGITVHPRQDERHIKRTDVHDLSHYIDQYSNVELNVEGYPSDHFFKLIDETHPDQCTLVPDLAGQLTSDHGWDIYQSLDILKSSFFKLHKNGVRSAIFVDYNCQAIEEIASIGYERIELYTEKFANNYNNFNCLSVYNEYRNTAKYAQSLGLGVNAGHDLNLKNLQKFLEIGNILEVSIGHALTTECIEFGIECVVKRYLDICNSSV